MKKLLKKTLLFLILSILCIETITAVLIYTDLYLFGYPGKETYHAIAKSKKKYHSKKLIIGDSVARQLFPNKKYNDTLNSLATNQAISMVGQYLLVNNYLCAGNKIDTLFALFNPFTFSNNLNQVYTFHYFLKPFDTPEYSSLFTSKVQEQLELIPLRSFKGIPHILATSWAPQFNPVKENNFRILSPISVEYLKKIKELSIQHHFKLILLPTPISIDDKGRIEKMDTTEFIKCNMVQEFREYFNKLIYFDNSYFSDGTHLVHPEEFTHTYKTEMLK